MRELEASLVDHDQPRRFRVLEGGSVGAERAGGGGDDAHLARRVGGGHEQRAPGALRQRLRLAQEAPLDRGARRQRVVERLAAGELGRAEQSRQLDERQWVPGRGRDQAVRDGRVEAARAAGLDQAARGLDVETG